MSRMVIKNGRLMNTATGREVFGHLVIEDGRIQKIIGSGETPPGAGALPGDAAERSAAPDAVERSAAPDAEAAFAAGVTDGKATTVIDASGLIVAPGFIDCHVHFRDPGQTEKEDMETGCRAAARGGYTTVLCMANTVPPIDTPERLRANLDKAAAMPIRVLQAATISEEMAGRRLSDMESLWAAGAACFTDDGKPLTEEALVEEAMKKAKNLRTVLSFHEENPLYIGTPGVNEGPVSREMGLKGAEDEAERDLTSRDILLAKKTGARIDIQHVSAASTVAEIRAAKETGVDIWAEATPHHFSLTEDAVRQHGTNAKMNPPLRTEEDRLAIIGGLKDGTLSLIATDHAPHTKEEKNRPFPEAPSGIIGLETALSLGITYLVKPGHLTLMELLEKMTINPALCFHLTEEESAEGACVLPETGIGTLTEDGPADLVLFDPEETWTVREEEFASKASNSPFIGETLTGKVKYTICRGKIVYRDE